MSDAFNKEQMDEQTFKQTSKGIGINQGEKSPEEVNAPGLKEDIRNKLNKLVHWKYFPILVSVLVICADIYLSFSQGIRTGISALAAEGTLALALVTYLQMRFLQRQPPM